MRKLKLDVELLTVESFHTATMPGGAAGTVVGASEAPTVPPKWTCGELCSNDGSCRYTCGASCYYSQCCGPSFFPTDCVAVEGCGGNTGTGGGNLSGEVTCQNCDDTGGGGTNTSVHPCGWTS